jgi:hypothetical protein
MDICVQPIPAPIGFETEGVQRGYLGVFDGDVQIGSLVEGGGNWLNGLEPAPPVYRVLDAGPGVPLPRGEYTSEETARDAILAARDAAADWLTPGDDSLTGLQRQMLRFELTPEASATDGRRDRAISDRFALSPTEYNRRLAALLADPASRAAAVRAAPAAVALLEARIAARRARRARLRGLPLDTPAAA